ncbi:Vitamin B12 ABC transporter, permease component BtuC [hydrothermal vent metagenome]|uniref:Vitamin B12 ABC transporter, permease component BtuC n=1 Tax=hydrothermal vent metagenome TaxID=652676 RepID=A0A1W1EJD1_9ZZZZ
MKKLPLLISIIIILYSPFVGQVDILFKDILNNSTLSYQIFWNIRVPRVIVGFFVGGVLSVGGMVFQTIFKNSLSSPYTLGVASGASLGVGIGVVFGFIGMGWLFGFLGALSTIIIHLIISIKIKNYDSNSMLLVGISLSFFYSALFMIILYISNLQQSYEIIRFTMGSLESNLEDALLISFLSISILFIIIAYKKELRFLLISQEYALLKGVNTIRVDYILLISISLGVGVAVSITGPIGFVGLIIPHIIKNIYKQSSDRLILKIFFYGGIFLIFCDMIARVGSSDIPIGVVSSSFGAPLMIYLILRK